jgi:hypothetical protein
MIDKQTKAGEYIPPAFPSTFHNGWGEPEKGMALRDYFAAKAMLIVMPDVLAEIKKCKISDEHVQKLKHVSAEACYGIADAMLKAREA